ncbi:hypothetical protein [Mucilaginibacter sp. 10I4]|uniref:hypothetical protein n=1 Tax=Mucilaginibacter sp. 10I4 TaxID=3048580 RepID=UPI002B2387F3|nr:hypothetical protein [Mucilaginibacter sp. 10I4]MEB0262879.1 hypothetical protein [Mucilaginibacter sp. 10I4]
MAKDYTWFKFKIPDWMMGRIQKQKPEVRGVFLNLTCKYWQKQCILSIEDAKEAVDEVEYAYSNLLSKGIITENDGMIALAFLDEQWAENEAMLENKRKGGKVSASKRIATYSTIPVEQNVTGVQQDSTGVEQNLTRVDFCSSIKNEIEENEIYIPKGIVGLDKPTPTVNTVSFSERCKKFIEKFNELRGTKFQATAKVKGSLNARLKIYSSVQIIEALKRAQKDKYHIESNFQYLTPEYILRQDVLERFLNASVSSSISQQMIFTNNVSN